MDKIILDAWVIWRFSSAITLALTLLQIGLFVRGQTTLSFCDGDDLFLMNEGDCPGGINFGRRRPPCVCITGVYRSWTKKCDLFDGFLHEYCSTLSDSGGVEEDDVGGEADDSDSLKGLKLIGGLRNIYEDTAAVFGEGENRTVHLIGMEGLTNSESFYTLNAFPVMLSSKGVSWICVQPRGDQSGSGQHVCRYLSYENRGVWILPGEEDGVSGGMIRIKVMESCDPQSVEELKGHRVAKLRKHICYDIMDRNASDCSLSCEMGQEIRIAGSSLPTPIREKKSPGGKQGMPSVDRSERQPPRISSELGGGEAVPSNANFAFHRKLNKYVRLRQVGLLRSPDFTFSPPGRTFALLEMAKHIVRHAIPAPFVSTIFLDTALELFLLLHRGQDFRYGEDIQPRDFKWIEEILLRCRVGVRQSPLNLQTASHPPDCEGDRMIQSVCKVSDGDILSCEKVEGGGSHQNGRYHFVIDVAWLIIDMTHAVCQPHFQSSYRVFHVWEQASEKLFTREIRDLWYLPQLDPRVWDAILSSHAMLNMINLERAVDGVYRHSTLPRLRRLPRQKRNFKRKRRNTEGSLPLPSVARRVDVYCANKREADFTNDC